MNVHSLLVSIMARSNGILNLNYENWHVFTEKKQAGNVVVMDMKELKSKIPFVAINYNCHWTVVNQLHIHHCAKAASLWADA